MASPAPQTIVLEANGLRFTAHVEGAGTPVLCLHGFPDHAATFRHQLPALAEAGLKGVAPLSRGYEPSSQPGTAVSLYHPLHVAEDAVVLAAHLSDEPIHLVGHDWGGIAAYAAAALAPERFRSLTTLAVAGPRAMRASFQHYPVQLRNSWYVFFFQLRGLADAVVRARDHAFIERLWRSWSPGWQWDEADMRALRTRFAEPGVRRSALSYYRAMLNPFLDESRKLASLSEGPIRVPTLAISGARDGCLDTRIHDLMQARDFPGGLRVKRLEGAGHFVHQERPEAVNALLLGWFEAWNA